MKIILKKNVPNLGEEGEIKAVADGYARNYLLPKGLAVCATEGAVKAWKLSEEKRKRKLEEEKENLRKTAEKISSLTLTFSRKVSEDGTMFGSVAKSDIIKGLKAVGITIHKDNLNLPASIKETGEQEVEIILKPEIKAKLKLVINKQG